MRNIHRMLALGLVLIASTGSFWAVSGFLVDPAGEAIEGAKICYLLGDTEGLCTKSDERGFYTLVDAPIDTVRITADGYLSRLVAAVPQEGPIRLEHAASLLIKLIDADSGKAIDGGEITLTYSSGHRQGPFPSNQKGVSIAGLKPGWILIGGNAEGYKPSPYEEKKLKPREETVVELKLSKSGS
ncbi:hypothetical protein ABI59_06290 [Acidobacteria bacterium Mor1]|nr:hypothetical protein ABI59_06290 [Acidobacteria bacterium Mor1]